jgi:3',5'-cyclic AMP phosphodiesterase CpdA
MFRLAHVSDIHLSPLPNLRKRDFATKRITGYLNWRFNRKHTHGVDALTPLMNDVKAAQADHLVVTGDLVNLALGPEFLATRHWLEKVGSPFDVSVVPGNHDAYVPGALAKACMSWTEYMNGDEGLKGQDPDPEIMFPYLRRRGPIAIIGVSSAVASAPFLATGRFREDEALEVAALLKQAKDDGLFRVVLIHHPPFRFADDASRRLYGIRLFQRTVLKAGAELVLHGHTHLNSWRMIGSGDGGIPVVGVPSASQGPGGPKPAARWNEFQISGEPGNWNCVWSERGITGPSGHVSHIGTRDLMVQSKALPLTYPA